MTFILEVPAEEAIKRNSSRLTCSVCRTPLLAIDNIEYKRCPLCAGEIIRRKDDNAETMKTRIEEYKNRTAPIFAEMEKKGYRLIKIDGTPLPYEIHAKIISYFE